MLDEFMKRVLGRKVGRVGSGKCFFDLGVKHLTSDILYIYIYLFIYLFILRNWIKGKSIGHPYILMENLWIPAIVPFYNFESSIISIPMARNSVY